MYSYNLFLREFSTLVLANFFEPLEITELLILLIIGTKDVLLVNAFKYLLLDLIHNSFNIYIQSVLVSVKFTE